MAPFTLCLETSASILETWFAQVLKDSSIFAINIKKVIPKLEALSNAHYLKESGLDSVKELDSIYNMLGTFIIDMVEDKLLIDQTLLTTKVVVQQVWTFREGSIECLKLTNMQEDHPGAPTLSLLFILTVS